MRPAFVDKPLWFHCALLAFLVCFSFLLTGLLIVSIPPHAYYAQAMANSLGFMLLPGLMYGLMVYRHPFRETGFTAASNGWYYPLAALVMLVSIPMVQVMATWNEGLHLPHFMGGADKWIRDMEQAADGLSKQMLAMPTPASLALNLFTIAVCAPLGEEVFFRGTIQKLLFRGTRNVHVAVWLGAIIFSAMHFEFLGFFPRVVLGVLLGYLYAFSGSLWPSILAHAVYNGSQVVYFYLQQHQHTTNHSPVFDNNAAIPLSYGLLSTALVLACFVWMQRLKPKTWP